MTMKINYFILSHWIDEVSMRNIVCYQVEPKTVPSRAEGLWSNVKKIDINHLLNDDSSDEVNTSETSLFHSDDYFIAVLPSELINKYRLEIPAKKRSDLMNIVPFSLEDEIAEKISDIHWTVVHWKPKSFADVVTVNKAQFEDTLAWFQRKGIDLDDAIPDYMILPVHAQTSHSLAKTSDNRTLIYNHKSGDGYGFDESLFNLWWQDDTNKTAAFAVNDSPLAEKLIAEGADNVSFWDFGRSPEDWLGFINVGSTINRPAFLLRDRYAKAKSLDEENSHYYKKALSIASIGMMVFLALSFVNFGYQSFKLNRVNAKVETSFNEMFGEDLYDANQNDWLQIRRQIARMQGNVEKQSTYFNLISMLSPMLGLHQQELQSIAFDGEILIAKTEVNSFDELNAVVNSFRAQYSNAEITIVDSEQIEGRVTGSYRVAVNEN